MGAWIRLLRPHQWAKNLLVFVGLIAAHRWGDGQAWAQAVQMFLALSLAASAVYVLNDALDVEHDRLDPHKRMRPLAAGTVPMMAAWLLPPVLLGLAVLVVWPLGTLAKAGFAAYVGGALAYNLGVKRVMWLDVVLLGSLYALRVIAGALAIAVEPSPWLVGFSMFLFLSLASLKRYAELLRSSREVLPGRAYRGEDAIVVAAFGVAAAVAATVVLALYVNDPGIAEMYHKPLWLWPLGPLVLVWSARLWTRAHRGELHGDPVLHAIHDPATWLTMLGFGLCLMLAR